MATSKKASNLESIEFLKDNFNFKEVDHLNTMVVYEDTDSFSEKISVVIFTDDNNKRVSIYDKSTYGAITTTIFYKTGPFQQREYLINTQVMDMAKQVIRSRKLEELLG